MTLLGTREQAIENNRFVNPSPEGRGWLAKRAG